MITPSLAARLLAPRLHFWRGMKPVLMTVALTALALACLTARADQMSSYDEVRSRVYRDAETGLDCYPAVGAGDVLKSLLHLRNRLTDRVQWTLTHTDDFMPATKPDPSKILHPMGVCASATWEVDQATPYTGMFAQGSHADAIVRFSTGNPVTLFNSKDARIFGIAVKLFPSRDPAREVVTRNLFFLDQSGLDGDVRPNFLTKENGALYWQNQAGGGGVQGAIMNHIFARFDKNPLKRPLKPAAEVSDDGQPVASPVSPDVIRLVPDLSQAGSVRTAPDFRSELLEYGAGEIRFNVVRSDTGARIGRLTIDKPIASETCDKELHFHHHRWGE